MRRNILLTDQENQENYNGIFNIASNDSSPPPFAGPLLEMGFPLKHISKAILKTNIHGEMNGHAINTLITWMLEHPYSENNSDVPSGLPQSESLR